ncbi:MAG: hypothetical protein QGG67_14135 [Gammaproteobacteria bacterium]|jgi:mannose-6-phosphate isomerase-like protein (cupin superfamily)|nr:hypothetical protein [Gammaproteobacteria bacterium]MDP6097101.1 hypothetical protein [Gammaproteobacteria bacterium]|tara:strand:- start:127 stop:606 length:480 start_codon:yes stop_codon:yes gene_type:complete
MNRIKLLLLILVSCSQFQTTFAQLPSLPDTDQEAPLNRAVNISREALVTAFRRMNAEDIATIRMLEGGEFNVNIRHLENITPENMRLLTHADIIDVWIVQEGSGVLITGGEVVGDVHQGGVERFISVGDMVYIPAGLPHGIKEASAITWFNIRFPEHRN